MEINKNIKNNADNQLKQFKEIQIILQKIKDNPFKIKHEVLTTDIYNYSTILEDIKQQEETKFYFADNMSQSEIHIRNFNLSNIIIIPFMSIIALIGIFLKRDKLILVPTIIIFAFIIPCCIIIGLELANLFLRIDLCSDVRKYSSSDFKPLRGKGLGYYVSCVSKENLINISTSRYELSLAYNAVYDTINKNLEEKGYKEQLPLDKRNNKLLQEFVVGKDEYYIDGVRILIDYNNILNILNNETQCVHAKQIIYNIEKNLCYLNLENNFDMLKYYFWTVIFYVFLAAGLNRFIVIINPNLDKNNEELIKANSLMDSKVTFFKPS